MSTKTKTQPQTTADALAAASAARASAETKHADALADQHAAAQHLERTESQLGAGDSSVTAAGLAAAQADVRRTELLAAAASNALDRARQEEAAAVAAHYAAQFLDSDGDKVSSAFERAKASVLEAVTTALAEYRTVAAERDQLMRTATREAKAAGLVKGQCDPFAGVMVARAGRGVDQLLVFGEPMDPSPSVADLLADVVDELEAQA